MKTKPATKPILTATQRDSADTVTAAYRHPESNRTVALHVDGEAYTATGIHCGKADQSAADAAAAAKPKKLRDKTPAPVSKPPMPPKAK
ncbi:hypothetical protein ACWPKS_15960 [Coraliomargarita sp. W4R72]